MSCKQKVNAYTRSSFAIHWRGAMLLAFRVIILSYFIYTLCASETPVLPMDGRGALSLAQKILFEQATSRVLALTKEPSAFVEQTESVQQNDEATSEQFQTLRSFRIHRVNGPPIIEGEFISPSWLRQATRLGGFTQSSPKEGAPATEKTIVYLGYDTKNLYVVFYCLDSDPSRVRANYSKRDDILSDDHVGIILDTFSDGRRAYKFLTNPLGVQADSLLTEEQGEDWFFDAVFQTSGKLTSFGYLATMTIPFQSIRFRKQFPQTWGINLVRSIKRKDEEMFWSPVYRDRRGFLNQAGKMTGLEEIARSHGYEFIPYVFASRTTTMSDVGSSPVPVRQSTAKTGLDIKYGITSNLTANVTINPDFNDLEADQPRLRVNRRFKDSARTFVPEKRPFFLERSDLFGTPINVFFTRKIVDPKYGAKITGKLGRYNLGLLSTRDEAPEREFSDDDVLFRRQNRHAMVNVLRLSRDLYNQSSVGLIALDREFGRTFNRLYGVDASFRFLEKYELTMQYVRSLSHTLKEDNERLTPERLQGAGYMLTVARSTRHLSMDGYYTNLSPGFRSDLGFIERSDVNQFGGSIRYDFWPEGRTLINWGPRLSYGRNYNHNGTLTDIDTEIGLDFELVGSTSVGVRVGNVMERFADINFRKHPVMFSASTERARKISGGFSYIFGPEINYHDNDVFLGPGRELSLDLTLRPNEHLKIQNVYLASRLRNNELAGLVRGFDAHIFQVRLNYQFNREFAIRFIPEFDVTQTHNLLEEDRARRTSERTRNFRGNFLFSYVLKPGTVLYMGYDSIYEDMNFGSIRRFRPRDRGFFVKFSYFFR